MSREQIKRRLESDPALADALATYLARPQLAEAVVTRLADFIAGYDAGRATTDPVRADEVMR